VEELEFSSRLDLIFYPEDGGRKFIRNASLLLSDYKRSDLRRQTLFRIAAVVTPDLWLLIFLEWYKFCSAVKVAALHGRRVAVKVQGPSSAINKADN
jgi:hypothetical protein